MKKVSIIVPCYNAENYIKRFLDSILNQTYRNLELILVNDGSDDKTEDLILSYKQKFEDKKIQFFYLKKENGGAASSINLGLKKFTGDYLIWPDSDDILHPESISKRVEFLENNKEYDLVRSEVKIVKEKNIQKRIGNFYTRYSNEKDIFLHIISEKIPACPGAFMLKRENILKNIPKLEIYESRGGQNWQIELPNTYNQKCGYIKEELYTYVIRKNSHSHRKQDDLDYIIERLKELKKILDVTILNIDMSESEKNRYLKIVENKYLKMELLIYCKLFNKKEAKIRYKKLKQKEKIDIKTKGIYILNQINLLKLILEIKKMWY